MGQFFLNCPTGVLVEGRSAPPDTTGRGGVDAGRSLIRDGGWGSSPRRFNRVLAKPTVAGPSGMPAAGPIGKRGDSRGGDGPPRVHPGGAPLRLSLVTRQRGEAPAQSPPGALVGRPSCTVTSLSQLATWRGLGRGRRSDTRHRTARCVCLCPAHFSVKSHGGFTGCWQFLPEFGAMAFTGVTASAHVALAGKRGRLGSQSRASWRSPQCRSSAYGQAQHLGEKASSTARLSTRTELVLSLPAGHTGVFHRSPACPERPTAQCPQAPPSLQPQALSPRLGADVRLLPTGRN